MAETLVKLEKEYAVKLLQLTKFLRGHDLTLESAGAKVVLEDAIDTLFEETGEWYGNDEHGDGWNKCGWLAKEELEKAGNR